MNPVSKIALDNAEGYGFGRRKKNDRGVPEYGGGPTAAKSFRVGKTANPPGRCSASRG
ncbi:hypothetical protein G6K85_32330 [Agrobacterium rhizogenes]|nr:hypothetical protein [Rhizobium rhizogenes]